MSSIAVFLVLGGATAFAASQLAKNSVGSKQLKKNAVTAAKIKKSAVTAAKIKDNAVTGLEVKDASLTGGDINLSTLGTVPSAATAASLTGQTPFFVRLGFGSSRVLATHGSVSLVADCLKRGTGDVARILMQTSQNGAVGDGETELEGREPADFLNVDTPANGRQFVEIEGSAGETVVEAEIDQGFVLGPDDKMLTANSEGIALGLNYGAPGCLFAGVINAVG